MLTLAIWDTLNSHLPNMTLSYLDNHFKRTVREKRPANTHGVSSMTLHTLAMVLRQSVVFSIGNFYSVKVYGEQNK